MKILVIDNYDSFTFNLVQQLGKFGCKMIVKRNDDLSLDEITRINPDKILISPGPKRPEDSRISLDSNKRTRQFYSDSWSLSRSSGNSNLLWRKCDKSSKTSARYNF